MHKVFKTILIVSIAGTSAFAQYFPVAGDKQVTIGMLGTSGNSAIIMLRKFKTETISNRYGASFGYNVSYSSAPSPGYSQSTNSSSINGGFSFGKQKNFNIGERFSPYLALDAGINFTYQPTNGNSTNELNDSSLVNANINNYTQRQVSSKTSNTRTSFSPGIFISPVIGFNYYIGKNFALGAECRFNVLSVSYTHSNNTSHSESSYILSNNYDPSTGHYSFANSGLITNKPVDTKTTSNGFNAQGSITPQFYITASYYFK